MAPVSWYATSVRMMVMQGIDVQAVNAVIRKISPPSREFLRRQTDTLKPLGPYFASLDEGEKRCLSLWRPALPIGEIQGHDCLTKFSR